MGFDTIIAWMKDGAAFEIGLEVFKGWFDFRELEVGFPAYLGGLATEMGTEPIRPFAAAYRPERLLSSGGTKGVRLHGLNGFGHLNLNEFISVSGFFFGSAQCEQQLIPREGLFLPLVPALPSCLYPSAAPRPLLFDTAVTAR